ncbi:MAG: hypothetical protein ACRC2R_14405 [Xenococcaceae cyanobacterium]
MMKRKILKVLAAYGAVILVMFSPMFLVTIVVFIAKLFNCQVHEGYSNPCLVLGNDIEDLLYGMGVFG